MANAGPIPSYETFVNRLYIQFIFKISVCASHPMKFICAFATSELYILACSLSICLLHLCVHPIWITFSICLLISVFFIFLSCLLKFSIRIIYTCRDFIGTLERKYQSKFSIWGITVLATEEVVFIYDLLLSTCFPASKFRGQIVPTISYGCHHCISIVQSVLWTQLRIYAKKLPFTFLLFE